MLQWIATGDLESWALLYELTDRGYSRIEPELGMEETCNFLLRYYLASIASSSGSGPNGHTRFEAAHELRSWLDELWQKRPDTNAIVQKLARRVTEVFLEGGPGVRNCIETGFLEHVFEREELVALFGEWKSHPELSATYDHCVEWGVAHRQK